MQQQALRRLAHTFEELNKNEVTALGNAAAILEEAARWNAELILSGHEHHPAIRLLSRSVELDKNVVGPLAVVGAGGFGLTDDKAGPIGFSHYNIIHRRENDVVIISRKFEQNRDGFEEHTRRRIRLVGSIG